MNVKIPYGAAPFETTLPDTADTLDINEPEQNITPEKFCKAVHTAIQEAPLNLSDTIIVVTDKTRVCGYPTYLPLLVEALEHKGLKRNALRFIIAYGTHPRQSDEECRRCYGEVYDLFPFIHHDCTEEAIFTDCGTTSRGVPIRMRRDILEASCVITMGPLCHHYFAGYGGGRKLLFPGCGERRAIYANHGLYLDTAGKRLASACRPGVLEDNPLAQDLFEIARIREADLALHGIMDSRGRLCDVVIGRGTAKYLEACRIHGQLCESSADSYPLVIASCGGAPKDINFIQSHKAIHNASMFVEDGGTLLIFSQCPEGIGSQTFLPWFNKGGFANAFDELAQNYQGNGGTALAMMTKTARIHIIMVTELPADICRTIGVTRYSFDQARQCIRRISAGSAYIANAGLLVKQERP